MKSTRPFLSYFFFLFFIAACTSSRKTASPVAAPASAPEIAVSPPIPVVKPIPASDTFLLNLMQSRPGLFDSILAHKDQYNVQIIYTRIERARNGRIRFTDHYFNVDEHHYFYPASSVKLPVAVLALQKLNELKIAGLDKNSGFIMEPSGPVTGVYNDPTTPDGRPTIAQYIRKILLVSDNDAFNRLYEFMGQEYINTQLHNKGYTDAQVLHSLDLDITDEQNRVANAVTFYDSNNRIVYQRPELTSALVYDQRNDRAGAGYIKNDQLVPEPFDFSRKNRLSLNDLHLILRSIMFPEAVAKQQRFDLQPADYTFLRRYMSMFPAESAFPHYDSLIYPDSYVKHWMQVPGDRIGDSIRIFNKTGTAYGFLTDISYIADFKNNIEFMLSAVIYCNSDGVINDNKYDYNTIGYPFFKNLGRAVYEYEAQHPAAPKPDLTEFRLQYQEK